MKIDELLGIRDWKKMQEHGIHDAEDGGVGSNPQGNSEDGNSGEDGRPCQSTKRIAKTLGNSRHGSTSALKRSYNLNIAGGVRRHREDERLGLQEVTLLSQD